MRPLVIFVPVLLLTAGEASAISNYQTATMSCARIQAAVQSDGVALLSYPARDNPSLQLFDRYVRDSSFCSTGYQKAQPRSVPASDTKNCKVRKCVRVVGGNR